MKIEKINDRQIRCTLTKADLADRELKISELAYGTDKAKSLFRDMMQQASFEYGFEAEDIPLMIEAIPLNSECIVLVITKVDDPEELDTRFSNFAPSIHAHEDERDTEEGNEKLLEGADEVLDLFKKIHEGKFKDALDNELKKALAPANAASTEEKAAEEEETTEQIRAFAFQHLSEPTRLAHVLGNFFISNNTLYKEHDSGRYILVFTQGELSTTDFHKVCNIFSEYGTKENFSFASEAYLREHYDAIIEDNALQVLAQI